MGGEEVRTEEPKSFDTAAAQGKSGGGTLRFVACSKA